MGVPPGGAVGAGRLCGGTPLRPEFIRPAAALRRIRRGRDAAQRSD